MDPKTTQSELIEKVVKIRVGERASNQVRLSFGGDTGVEILREELLAGRKASA